MEGSGGTRIGIGAANCVVGIAPMTHAAPATAIAVERQEGNQNGKCPRSGGPEVLRAPIDLRSRMKRTMQEQAQELTQLHKTVGHLANLLAAQAGRREAQW